MRIDQVKVCAFDELDPDIQEKILDRHRYWNVECHDWWDYEGYLELTQQEMDEAGITMDEYTNGCLFKWKKIYFDLDRNFHIQFHDLQVTNENILWKFLMVPERLRNFMEFDCYNGDSRWNTPNTKSTIAFVMPSGDRIYEDEAKGTIRKILEQANSLMDMKIYDALKMLRDEYDYLTSDEAVAESLIANEMEFLEDGTVF